MKNLFKTIIRDFHTNGIVKFYKRDLNIPVNSGKIITIIGPRRAGKTFLFFQIMEKILETSSIENILYINFEDERLSKKQEDLQYLIEAYLELYPQKKDPIYLFFDEIQNINNWEKFVRRMYDTLSKNIFITGSSSNFLNKEIASSLRGRGIVYELYPLSFKEYLGFKNIAYDDKYSTSQKGILRSEFDMYLVEGGFPEIVFTQNDLKPKIFHSYFDVMIYRDIIERYQVRNISALKYFIKKSISSTSNKLSINKLFNELKSQGIKLSKDTLYGFANYVQDCYLIFLVNKYSKSLNVQNINDKKMYCVDNGLANAVSFKFSEDYGSQLENLVLVELKRRGKEIYYEQGKYECDFVILKKSKIITAVQVTREITEQNKDREINGLLEAMHKFDLSDGLLITEDQSDKIKINGNTITVLPIWRWLLTNKE